MAVEARREVVSLDLPPGSDTALAALEEPVRRWFRRRYGEPTAAQRLAWPTLAAGEQLLLSAPTGSGKTLAAFLPLLGGLLRPSFASGIRGLYLAPLKALVNDLRRNLRLTLRGIRQEMGESAPTIRVGLRTGDTSARARRLLRVRPPDVLLTTPESLAILLSQKSGADLFASLCWVVVDEVHALAGNKRGADLALSLERLTELAGGTLQRVGLSATCAPLAEAARFLAGVGRPCTIARADDSAPLELTIEPLEDVEAGGFLARLLERLEPELRANRSTLIFANTRALAERLVWGLRRRFPAWAEQIAPHHSALAAARRRDVERRFKRGALRAVVSSTSLELGIDIGAVDGVVLVHPPGGVVRLLQRVGRSGHEPRRVRRGLVLTASPAELLEATVTAASSRAVECEPLRVPSRPLDVLCQQLLGMAAQRPWLTDEAYVLVRRAYPYRDLSRADFDDCLAYLSGEHPDGRAWLPARLHREGDEFVVRDARTARLVRQNLGTIVADEPRAVRLRDGPAVGAVDEAFADRLQPGDRFLLDGRCLELQGTEAGALLVEEVVGRPAVPRWGSEGLPLSAELARRLYLFRVRAAEALRDGPDALAACLRLDYGLQGRAVAMLIAFFERQESISEIPDSATCLVEAVRHECGTDAYIHTPLHRSGNDALARVAVLRLARRGVTVTSLVADLGFALLFPDGREHTPEHWLALLDSERFEHDLTEALADSVTLRERFRRVALTGLMLLRNPAGGRRRVGGLDWAERRLFEQVRDAAPNFVLLRQALREVREECCDADAAAAFLQTLPRLCLRCRRLPAVSPFAENWTQLTAGGLGVVESPAESLRRLHAELTGAAPSE